MDVRNTLEKVNLHLSKSEQQLTITVNASAQMSGKSAMPFFDLNTQFEGSISI